MKVKATSISNMMTAKPKQEKSSHTTMEAHGDGTYSTSSGYGEKMQHPTLGHALSHMAKMHSPMANKHIGALKQAINQFLDEEAKEKE